MPGCGTSLSADREVAWTDWGADRYRSTQRTPTCPDTMLGEADFLAKLVSPRRIMPRSRREFLPYSSLGMLAAAMQAVAQTPAGQAQELPPGAPPAFGTAPPVGPEVSPATFAEAEKLVQLEMTAADRATAASNWRMQMAPLLERRTGPRKIALESTLAPATQWNPSLPGSVQPKRGSDRFVRSGDAGTALPAT